MPRGMQFARRRKGITNYRKRLALLKSGIPRAVVRFSNAKVSVQIIEFANEGDKVLAAASSNDVTGMGWKGSKTNVPVSYLSGMLAAKRAVKAGVSSAVLDIGRVTPTPGGRAFSPGLLCRHRSHGTTSCRLVQPRSGRHALYRHPLRPYLALWLQLYS